MKKITRDVFTWLILLTVGSVFIYGNIQFPDGPIVLRSDGMYVGKQGQLHSKDYFDRFGRWSVLIYILVPAGIIGLAILQNGKIRGKRIDGSRE